MPDPRVCIDRRPLPRTPGERLALLSGTKWQPGDAIRIRFLDGAESLRARVRAVAETWTQHANLTLFFGDSPDAEVRISFEADPGSWSYLGTDCRTIAAGEPTMNYGWLTDDSSDDEVRRVVLHEFGHALGAIHEHQNPAGGIKWNKPVVYAYYAGPPNNWSQADVDGNLFATYGEDVTVHTDLDPTSIMMYPIPAEFTLDGFEVGLNTDLSETDKAFMRKQYP